MEDTVIVIMLKDNQTGILQQELSCCKIYENENLIVNAFVVKSEELMTHMIITVDKDVDDSEFSDIYDYYDNTVFGSEIKEMLEIEDCFNPTWEIVFPYISEATLMEEKINKLLKIHQKELSDIYKMLYEGSSDSRDI